jgi:talin
VSGILLELFLGESGMDVIVLKVSFCEEDIVKDIEIDSNATVGEASELASSHLLDQESHEDFGLVQPGKNPNCGTWLDPKRTVQESNLHSGDVLQLRRRKRLLKVKTMDGSLVTLMIDESAKVMELIQLACSKIGLKNSDEFSFVTETNLAKHGRLSLLTSKRFKPLRRRLTTTDEVHWLDPAKSLREHGIEERDVLVLRKRFFFSEESTDSGCDPKEVHLMYVQARDAVLNQTHPVTKASAIELAALQCQIEYGNFNQDFVKAGILILANFIPVDYVKSKNIEAKIFQEYEELSGLAELKAKLQYIQLCRSLKTYGVTFFLVKEKMKGRNKLVPRLLGITRESVMRVDESSKEMLKTWPLTTVRRWAASPNSFTLDFGDYSESYYSVQTTEGETISQLIAGYIDIIIKKKKARQFDADEDDDENAITEFEVGSKRANVTSLQGGGQGTGVEGSVANRGNLQQAMQEGSAQMHEGILPQQGQSTASGTKHTPPGGAVSAQVLQAQQMLKGTINDGIGTVTVASTDLNSVASLPSLGSDSASIQWRKATLDVSKQNVSSALAAMLASTASIITFTGMDPSDVNYTAVGSAVTTISTNLTELVKAIRLLAALSSTPDEGQKLLDAARKLAAATAGLLNTAQPENVDNRQDLLVSAGEMGSTGGQLLQLCGEATVDMKTQETLIAMAKAVASSTAALVSNARTVASKCEDQALQNQVISGAKATALATQALIACTKVLSPTIDNPLCQEQLIEACKLVAGAVERIVIAAQAACDDDDALRDLGAAATAVTQALHSLIQQIREGLRVSDNNKYDEACEVIIAASESLVNALGNAQEMVSQAKRLAEATQSLVNSIKLEADGESDADARKRLLDAAKSLADATSRMVESAKGAAKNSGDPQAQQNLQGAAVELRNITNSTATAVLKKRAIRKLEVACRHACAICTQLIAAAQGAGSSNTNESSQQQLLVQCKAVSEQVSHLVQCVRASMSHPDMASTQLGLINASQSMLAPAGRLVAASKAAVPTVNDPAAALQLGNFAKATAGALAELRNASSKAAEVCGSLEIDSAIDLVRELSRDMEMYKREAAAGKLLLLPGETVASCALELGAVSKAVGSSMAQLLTAANQGNESYTGVAARETANSLKILAKSVRGVAAGTSDKGTQDYILQSSKQVMDESVSLIREAKTSVESPNQPNKQLRLAQAAKAVSQALNQVVNCLPGQRDVDHAIRVIAESSQALQKNQFPPSGGEAYHILQSKMKVVVGSLNESAASLFSAARGTPDELAIAAKTLSQKYQDVLQIGLTLAGASHDKQTQDAVIGYLRTISVSSSKLLLAAKSLSADPNAPNVMNQLTAAARAVTDSINELLDVCTSYGPGQRECDNALRKIEAAASLLESPSESVSDVIYYECLETVTEKSQVVAQTGAQIPLHAKNGAMDLLGTEVINLANAVCQITEATAQSAYLVGIGDSTSIAAQQGLVDQTSFARASQAISIACQSLLSSSSTQQQVLAAATVIAKHTSVLCNACKTASQRTSNPVAKKHFVTAAKEVANNTANLVKNIKALAGQLTAENREACASTTKPLIESVDALTTFASSPQFCSTRAVIGEKGRQEMQPILSGGKSVISSSCSLLAAAKNLAVNPNDAATWQMIAAHAKALGDSVRALITALKDKAPGQHECEKAIELLNATLGKMDKAGMAVLSQTLPPMASSSLEGFQERVLQTCSEIGEIVDPLTVAAMGEAENLGHRVTALANQFPQLAVAAIGTVSRTQSSQLQMSLVQETKTVIESALQLLYASKEAGGNPKSTTQDEVNEAGELVKDAVKELSDTIQNAGSDVALINTLIEEVKKATAKVDEIAPESSRNFTDYQEAMFDLCKLVAKKSQDIAIHTGQDPSALTADARELTDAYSLLLDETRGAIGATETDEVAIWLKKSVCSLGTTTAELLVCVSAVVSNPDDPAPKRELLVTSKGELEKVSNMVAALKSGSKGTQACNEAVSTISGLIGDLETTAMFAAAGALQNEAAGTAFAEHRENILLNAKVLVEDTKYLVGAAGLTQERLAEAAIKAIGTITKETEYIKLGASSLGTDDIEAQVSQIFIVHVPFSLILWYPLFFEDHLIMKHSSG